MRAIVLVVLLLTCVHQFECEELDYNNACGRCIILTPIIKSGNASLARSLSQVDSDIFLGLESYAGFMTVKEKHDSNLFFWFFPAKTHLESTPWIIWLQGGPGISSMLGLFYLVGPLKIEDGEVKLRNITWSSDYSVVFVDNPVGAGFSFTNDDAGYPNNEDDVGLQLLEFVRQFVELFPELREAPLFLAGESYAGKYVPALGIQIHKFKSEENHVNLRGLMISSAFIEPRKMMGYSQLITSLGLMSTDEINTLKTFEKTVEQLIDEGNMTNASNKFNETIEYIKKHSGVDVYNFNRDNPADCKAHEFEDFLNRPEVRKAIGAGNVTYHYNNQKVYQKMLPDITNSSKPLLEELLECYGIICYHGQQDILVPYSLATNVYNALNWSGRQEYTKAPRKRVRSLNGEIVAYKKSGGNFTDVLIRRAGHMISAEQPEVTKFVIDQFINKYK